MIENGISGGVTTISTIYGKTKNHNIEKANNLNLQNKILLILA